VSEWANAIVADWGDEIEHVVSAHFPAFSAERGETRIAARKFAEAFEWAATSDETPKEFVDTNDLKSLELVVRVLRFLKAVPP
jgi:hypothetical protein